MAVPQAHKSHEDGFFQWFRVAREPEDRLNQRSAAWSLAPPGVSFTRYVLLDFQRRVSASACWKWDGVREV